MLAVFVVDMIVDRLFKMDFSQRLILLVCMIAVAAAVAFWKLIKPMSALPSNDALVYEIEKGNKSLGESLISSIELSKAENLESIGVSEQLASATINKGIEDAEGIDFGNVIDKSQAGHNQLILGAAVALLILLAIGVTQTQFLSTWFNRNIMLGDAQWPQGTYLEIVGSEDGRISLPRGVNHRQLVNVTEASSNKDVSVNLELESPDGSRTIYSMKPTGKLEGRQHSFMFNNLSSEFRFRASGGDDVTSWVQVSLVEPPAIVDLAITAHLPAYTGAQPMSLKGDGPHPLLAGTWLDIRAQSNKPLTSASLKSGKTSFAMALSDDGTSFSATPGKSEDLVAGPYEFELLDEGKLGNARKSKFTITLKEDQVPRVRAELLGISGLISARAILPTEFQVADDFGLTDILFRAKWKAEDVAEQPPAEEAEKTMMIDSVANHADASWTTSESAAAFDLLPLKLTPGTSLRLAVVSHDNQPDGAGEGKSQEFLLRVVTDEKLRADLLRREDEQRKAFEQAYAMQLSLATELEALSVSQPKAGQDEEAFHKEREMKLLELVRNQKGVGTAIDQIAGRFEEFLVEITNNRLDEIEKELAPDQPRINERYDTKIIQPIRQIDTELITEATRFLDKCRRVEREDASLQESVASTLAVQEQILARMNEVLKAMNDSRSFQDLLNSLLEIKRLEEQIKKKLDEKMEAKDIFEDADPDDIFEKD